MLKKKLFAEFSLKQEKAKKLFLLLSLVSLSAYSEVSPYFQDSQQHARLPQDGAMVVSVSSDGNYAVSSHLNGDIVLWDILNKTHRIIAEHANIYSAYFIKNTLDFMWQNDDTNEVIVQNVSGNKIFSLQPGFSTYGQVMTSDLKHYFASDEDWDIYSGYGDKQKLIMKDWGGFLGVGKLLNLTLSSNDKVLLSSGVGGDDNKPLVRGKNSVYGNTFQPSQTSYVDDIVIWNVETGQPLHKFLNNGAKTIATISPDGKYVVGGDEGSFGFVWDVHTGIKKLKLDDLFFGKFIPGNDILQDKFDNRGLIKKPDDFINYQTYQANSPSATDVIFALKFIDTQGHYLRFTTSTNYAILYDVNNPRPLKYLRFTPIPLALNGDWDHDDKLLNDLQLPSVNGDYSRDETIDTAPKVNILVTGQGTGDGINVYHYDPKAQTLTEIWSPRISLNAETRSPKSNRLSYIKNWMQKLENNFLHKTN